MRFAVLVLALVLVAVAALAGGERAAPVGSASLQAASAVRGEATRDCASRVESGGRRARPVRARRGDIATPSVIFHGLRSAVRFDPDDAHRPGGGDAGFKAGLSVRAGPVVVVELATRGDARIALDFDREEWGREGRTLAAGDGQRAVRFIPCPPDEPRFSGPGTVGRWTQYNGGLLIATPGCATLRLLRDGSRAERAPLAVGVPAARCR